MTLKGNLRIIHFKRHNYIQIYIEKEKLKVPFSELCNEIY